VLNDQEICSLFLESLRNLETEGLVKKQQARATQAAGVWGGGETPLAVPCWAAAVGSPGGQAASGSRCFGRWIRQWATSNGSHTP